MKEQSATLNRTQSELTKREFELNELKDTIQSKIGTTKYGDAVEYVSSLLQRDVLKDERDKLKLVKSWLIKGDDDDSMHIPQNLNGDEQAFIMKELKIWITKDISSYIFLKNWLPDIYGYFRYRETRQMLV